MFENVYVSEESKEGHGEWLKPTKIQMMLIILKTVVKRQSDKCNK